MLGAMASPPGSPASEHDEVLRRRRDQMLKLVAKGFFRELVQYGMSKEEILRVAGNLLDGLLGAQDGAETADPGPAAELALTASSVVDEWEARRQLVIGDVTLLPLDSSLLPRLGGWLAAPSVREAFVPPYPAGAEELRRHFERSDVDYFAILHLGEPVGVIGGENVDRVTGRLEMKKLVGEAHLHGKGIGKRATFGFLYYAFGILGMHKVYTHSLGINVRNLNLNSRFGFELEGVFLEEARVGERRVDVLRMALLEPLWSALHGFTPR